MSSTRLFWKIADFISWPFDTAKKLPYRWLRFVGMLVSIPVSVPFVLLSLPLMLVWVLMDIWEETA